MKKCLSRWLAALSSLVMLAASATPAALAEPVPGRAAPALDFSASTAVATGGIVEFTLDASNIPAEGWNVLELSIEYDDERLTPIDSKTDGSLGWNLGESPSVMSQINLRQSPIRAAAISSNGYNQGGRYLTLAFQMDGVVRPGSWLELEVTLTRCSRMVTREEGDKTYFDHFEDVVAPRTETLSVYVLPPQSDDVELNFVSDRSTVLPGETVQLSAIVAGLDGAFSENPVNVWNVLEYNIEYDEDELTPVQQATSTGRPMDYGRGDALVEPMPTIEVNLNTNPVLVGAIEAEGQYGNGEIMNIAFEVADSVRAGDTITLTVDMTQFAKSVIVDNKPLNPVDLVTPRIYTVNLTVGEETARSIEVAKLPDKVTYNWGEELDLTGMEMLVTYGSGAVQRLPVTPSLVSGYDPTRPGKQTLTVTYMGKTATFSVWVGEQPPEEDVNLDFVADQILVFPGDTVKISAVVDGLDGAFLETPANVWNVLEYNIKYDADVLTPVQQATSTGRPMDYGRGDALVEPMPTIEVNLNTNPVLVGAIEAEGQYGNGEIMNIAFEVADNVQVGDTITLTVNMSQFAKAVIVDNQPQSPMDLVAPGAFTVTLTVGEPQPAVESIAVTKQPDKTVYQQGEGLDLTGMEITAFYSDDTTKVMAVTPDMVSGYDPQKIGAQPLTVTYEGKTTTFVVTVEEPVVPVSIAVTKQPAKTVYRWGEMLDLTGMEITAFYSDNATQKVPVTSDMVSGYNPYKAGPQSLTVTYEGKTTTFVVTVEEQVIPVSIAVTSRPDKTDYQWGEALDLTGMEITVYYSDDTTKVVPVTSDMVSGYDPYNAGQQTLTVSCEGQITTFVVTVNEPVVLESIAVTKQPDKTAYLRGEALDLMGMEITAFYSDDSSKAVPVTLAMVSGYDPQKIGQQPLTVTYEGKTTTFVVTVNEPVVLESIAVTKQPDKTSYLQGEALDLTGMEITVFYSDDTTETMAVTSDMVSGYNPQQLGTQALLVTYESKTTTFVVTVNEPVVLESIQLDTTAATVEYMVGDELDLTGLVVTATYSDDSTAPVAVTPAMVTGFDNAKVGKQTLTVTYEEKTATFEVTVYKLGDVNLDGEVKSEDALMALQAATQKIDLDEAAALAANVNGDGEITSADALQILQYATQKINSFTGAA